MPWTFSDENIFYKEKKMSDSEDSDSSASTASTEPEEELDKDTSNEGSRQKKT